MNLLTFKSKPEPGASAGRRSLVPYLLGAIWLQLCLLLGLSLAPYLAPLPAVRRLRTGDPTARMTRHRRSLADPARDPRPGEKAPKLHLRTVGGAALDMQQIAGRRVILLFGKGDVG